MNFLVGIVVLVLGVSAQDQLLFVQETFRHGARYPIYPSEKDNTMYAVTENKVGSSHDNAGELTSAGKRMHYLLGQRIYSEYWAALGLGNTLNASQIFVKSTNINRYPQRLVRTIESAQSHMLGML